MTDKTKIVSVRLPVETVEEIEKRLKAEGFTLREMLTEYSVNTTHSGKNEKLGVSEGVNTQTVSGGEGVNTYDMADYENLRQMGCFLDIEPRDMIHKLAEGLERGIVTFRDGEIVGQTDLNLDALEEVCHEKGLDLQKAIDKAVLMLWK